MEDGPIVLFDGVCDLCNGVVRFTIEHDPDGRFRFCPLQTGTGERLLAEHGLETDRLDTFVLIEDGEAYTRSEAAVRLLRGIGGGWGLLGRFLGIIPRLLRDLGYRLVARSRYRVFGRQETCMVPGPDVRDRFLQEG